MKLDRAKRTSKPKTNLSAAHAKQPNTTETRAQTSQNRTAKKLPNAAFWCPKDRWNSTVQNARQPMRNSQTPPRHEPKPAKTAPQKNCLTLLSDALKKDEPRPCKTHLQTKNAAVWCPKERWNSTVQNARQPMRNSQTPPRHEPKPAKTAPQKNCLTLLSDARKKDEPRPCKTHLQTAKKLPNAAFWCPKERWNSTVQNAPPHQKPTSRQPMRNSQTPPRHEPKPAKTAPQKNCLTLLSDALKKDETRPCKTHLQTKNQPLGSPCETAKHHLDTSPNQPKPHRTKTA